MVLMVLNMKHEIWLTGDLGPCGPWTWPCVTLCLPRLIRFSASRSRFRRTPTQRSSMSSMSSMSSTGICRESTGIQRNCLRNGGLSQSFWSLQLGSPVFQGSLLRQNSGWSRRGHSAIYFCSILIYFWSIFGLFWSSFDLFRSILIYFDLFWSFWSTESIYFHIWVLLELQKTAQH